MRDQESVRVGRRAFLKGSALVLASSAALETKALAAFLDQDGVDPRADLRIGLVTDLHYADKPPASTRYFRETPKKLSEAAERFQDSKLSFLVELGDMIDSAESLEAERDSLKRINKLFSEIARDRHYVLGNHCVQSLTKAEFLDEVGQAQSYESFDRGGFHFVTLDACYREDGQPYGRKNFTWTDTFVPDEQLKWLKADLEKTDRPVVVFVHQRLDVTKNHSVRNAPQIRAILEASKKVRAVFQGHNHKNDYQEIAGIHYTTLRAMIEGSGPSLNGYSVLETHADGTLRLVGFRKQVARHWAPESRKA